MDVQVLDTTGMKCPQPMLKLAVAAPQMNKGQMLKIVGDCPTFETDLKTWCSRLNKTIVRVDRGDGNVTSVTIAF